MKKLFFATFCLLFIGSFTSFSQIKRIDGRLGSFSNFGSNGRDSLPDNEVNVKLSAKTKYTDFKIISFKGDTTLIDTTLTIKKEYKFNFLRKDNFELLAFHNQGQTFNNLAYDFNNTSLFPDFGFRAKHFNYYQLEDVNYYQVATPTTQIIYRSGLEQGQVLDALFTLNFSKRLNVAIEYKGLRSLGHYRRSLASHGNFRTSFHYETKKGQYTIKGQVVIQDITNQESGGITDAMVIAFTSNDANFTDRGRIDVNLTDAESLLDAKRYYFEHTYRLFSTERKEDTTQKDSITKSLIRVNNSISKSSTTNKDHLSKNNRLNKIVRDSISKTKTQQSVSINKIQQNFTNLKIGHSLLIDNKFYKFTQLTLTTSVFGDANVTGNIENIVTYQRIQNQVFLDFNSKYILGKIRGKITHSTYTYGYNKLTNINAYPSVNLNKLKGNAISFGADWKAKVKQFQLNASATITPGSGRLSGSDFRGEAFYKKDSVFSIKGRLILNSKSPNFNMLFHQSNYNNYNWQNNFNSIDTRNIGGFFDSKWGNASLDLTNISNYVYFDESGIAKQSSEKVNYLKLKVSKEFKMGKFALDNTVMYQNVSSGGAVFRVPEFITRNTLYYTDSWFKGKPLLVQIGATFKYFTKYKANAYNPLLAEFTLQNTTDIGYPTVDVFFNARIRRTRIYFKLDNVTSGFTTKNYFSAPNYPYRDLSIRFGLVWNWFI